MAKRVGWRCGQLSKEACKASDCDVMRCRAMTSMGQKASTYQLEIP
jgi:hypothetical protein